MISNIVADTYEKLAELVSTGKEAEAHDFLASRMKQLPEALQADILGIMLAEAVHEEAREMEAVQQVQKEGVAAMKALVALKESLEKSGHGQ
ncbi:hypothetical protein A3C21_02745 [Candidatus Kaiserbacteria bacterium RIFCSPHIGHO2_02_FULL_59_21]|uniref:Uncharacterized protein n=1 Tax=Candidatus Kaiserbacteria bacterium RIFCSPHIGHO2_02_FULL_59_21 TaxID=1798500 RepID=A0A1F6E012_9BACT|nr:MAG: hypothetical protein A3C21_02745 [Candidatus Kaiserbacteria bacterium RIFCSPHIGHO2_02_FULL_59_21]